MGKLRATPELWASLLIDAPWLKLERHASRDTRSPITEPAWRWCGSAGKLVPASMRCGCRDCAPLQRSVG